MNTPYHLEFATTDDLLYIKFYASHLTTPFIMPKSSFSHKISKFSGYLPLRVTLVLPFTIQIVLVVSLIWYLSFSNGQKSVNEVTTQLRNEITTRIEQHIHSYLKMAPLINQMNADALRMGLLNLDQPESVERYFWQHLQTFDYISYVSYASTKGDYIGVERREKHDAEVGVTGNKFYLYTKDSEYLANNQGGRLKLTNQMKDYDPRTRPWFIDTVAANRPIWSQIYALLDPTNLTKPVTLSVSANQPYYDDTGTLRGVLGTDIFLSQISGFLNSLQIGQTGKTFIMERTGEIVASSTAEKPYLIDTQTQAVRRLKAYDSEIPLIYATAQFLSTHFQNLANITSNQQLEFEFNGYKHFLQVKPLQDQGGIDWLTVVVIPQSDFMEHIRANTRTTVLLCSLALFITILLGLPISQWLVEPVLRLKMAARRLAEGEWEQDLPLERADEIGDLAWSFRSMAIQLKDIFKDLENKVVERTAQLQQKNELIRKIFGRYLSDEIVTNLLESETGLSLGGERREITLLTSDLRGFTAQSERFAPEEVIKIINLYLATMAEVITQYQGTIDEFMGDGILVLFGAPTVREDDTERAIACAIAMQLAMETVNAQVTAWGFSPLEMGIGINTGEVVVGNIGSEKRTKYGVIGKEVNLTYRIESYTTGGQILISWKTLQRSNTIVSIREEKQVHPKGIQHVLTIYHVVGMGGKYHLKLPFQEEVFVEVPEQILLQYTMVEGKHLSETAFYGSLIKLSAKGALIRSETQWGGLQVKTFVPDSLSNIKLNFLSLEEKALANEDVYAKVLGTEADENCFYVHFTAKPANVGKRLMEIYRQGGGQNLS